MWPRHLSVSTKEVQGSVVAVVDEHAAGFFREAFQPGEQAVAVGVAADAGESAHLGGDADVFAKELDLLRALDDLAAERALGLIADEEDGGLFAPEVVLQMVADAAGVAHAAGGEDDLGRLIEVDGLALLGGDAGS